MINRTHDEGVLGCETDGGCCRRSWPALPRCRPLGGRPATVRRRTVRAVNTARRSARRLVGRRDTVSCKAAASVHLRAATTRGRITARNWARARPIRDGRHAGTSSSGKRGRGRAIGRRSRRRQRGPRTPSRTSRALRSFDRPRHRRRRNGRRACRRPMRPRRQSRPRSGRLPGKCRGSGRSSTSRKIAISVFRIAVDGADVKNKDLPGGRDKRCPVSG